MRELPTVSVVAASFRRRDKLPAFVEPLLAQPQLAELVIAVDGSDDGSVEWLEQRRRADGRLVVVDLPNRGAGPARQAGVEVATGDLVLLMDDDVIASPGLVEGHARHHAGPGPRLVLGYMPNDWRALPRGRRGIGLIYRRAYELHCERFARDPAFVLHGLWGGNFSMPRDVLCEIRLDRLAVPRGQDDREFGLRCLKAGVTGVYDPALHALHLYDRDLAAFRSDCRIQGQSRRMIHDIHADLLGDELVVEAAGSEVPDAVGQGLPASVRRIWPTLAREPLFGPVSRALCALFEAGVRAPHLGLEVTAARTLGSLETMRGVLDAGG